MKRWALFFAILLIPSLAAAATVQLVFEWDANREADLAGYRLYQSDISGQYTKGSFIQQVGKVTTTSEVIDILPGDATYFVLTAFDLDNNESGFSNEVTFFLSETSPGIGPSPPTFRLRSWGNASSTR